MFSPIFINFSPKIVKESKSTEIVIIDSKYSLFYETYLRWKLFVTRFYLWFLIGKTRTISQEAGDGWEKRLRMDWWIDMTIIFLAMFKHLSTKTHIVYWMRKKVKSTAMCTKKAPFLKNFKRTLNAILYRLIDYIYFMNINLCWYFCWCKYTN